MASIQKTKNGYRVRVYYYDENGKRRAISKSVKKSSEAKDLARQLENDIKNKKFSKFIPTLKEYATEYIETYRVNIVSQSSVNIDRYSLNRLFEIRVNKDKEQKLKMLDENIKLDKVTGTMLQKLVNTMFESGYSQSSVRKTTGFIYRVMERAIYDGLIVLNPALKIEYKSTDEIKYAKYIPKENIKPFLDDVKRRNIYHYFLFRLILETGLRIGEACALTWQDIDRSRNVIKVSKSYDQKNDYLGNTKTKHHREVYISQKLSVEIFKLLQIHNANKIALGDSYENKYNFVFVNEFGQPIPRSSIHNTMIYCSEKVLGKGNRLSVHKLRHTHATLLLESGVNIKVIQKRLGHQSMEMTEKVYAHVTPELQDESVEIFEAHMKNVF